MDLFDQTAKMTQPLADRIRPRNLSEFVGQEHLVGEDKLLRKLIESDQLPSLILWGPPGSGKTTLAYIIANSTNSYFVKFSAVAAGIADVRKVVKEAQTRLKAYAQRTILFIDELHRFNKAQQDAFLPHVERGTIVLIGATTENPSFEVIPPLLSRCRVLVLNQLTPEEIREIIKQALKDKEKGLGNYNVKIKKDALDFLCQSANGDARIALNALEITVHLRSNLSKGPTLSRVGPSRVITLSDIEEALQHKALSYDRAGEEHYSTISAFIKSLRGSDPDAALYYLARMLEAGEDPLFISRRMVILASEDIGNADPQALPLAVATFEACERVGLPECQINLAQCVTYLASAPKSNASYSALLKAQEDVKRTLNEPIPLHIRNAPTSLMKDLGYGKGYKYAHNFEEGYTHQRYLPDKLKDRRYYFPTEQGVEAEIKKRLEYLRKITSSKRSLNSKCPKGLG